MHIYWSLGTLAFEVSTLDYEEDRKRIEKIIADIEWGLHEENIFEVGEPSRYFGWAFFTVSVNEVFLSKMAEVYGSFTNAKGWTYYEKFENWLRAKLGGAGSGAKVQAVPQEYGEII